MSTRRKILLILIVLIIMSSIYLVINNSRIGVSNFDYRNEDIPEYFSDFKIVQISDLHNKKFGKGQEKLLNKIKEINPDIIVITGDMIDRNKFNLVIAMEFIKGALDIAPVYYVSGNHEYLSNNYTSVKESLVEAGVVVLENQNTSIKIEIGGILQEIHILGLTDPSFNPYNFESIITNTLSTWEDIDGFKILLSHRPELFNLYKDYDIDLVFSGHAHGGQIRMPFIGGLFAPDQGFFPEYTNGSYQENDTTMFVSRGLGNSVFPLRVFNNPEIVVVTLKTK